ncbi:tyrosine-protein phosphatase non-receptor type substrate 1 [Sarcophilus harrisii]|uniref:Ig-like domain-containing protein n=1 Tax=Sarcophilus harrisii TaxID=9305 RepID=A0A7N4NKH7_SARHA|nr:tyrosine-protein phosphatase non-receptor type substrate 1 [Sarcophilus harrisii]
MFSLSFWASSLLTVLHICECVDTQSLIIEQPLNLVTAVIGGSAILPCRLKGIFPAGPVKWFKGTKPDRQFIFSDKESSPRVHKINNTNSVWDICIHNITIQDEGTYYCVKFRKDPYGELQSGSGTFLSIAGSPGSSPSSSSSVVLTAAIAVSLVLIFILLVLCYYFKRSKGPSPCLARLKASKTNQSQKEPSKNKEIVYADLHLRKDHPPRSPVPEPGLRSEYATIHI